MPTTPICPSCGKLLAASAPKGLCPECLMKGAFPTGTDPATGGAAKFIPPKPADLAPYFPQLEILEFIGQGGMGAVYQARQPALERLVALKILPPDTAGDPGFATRFTREARALARLNHPNIVAVHDFGQAGGFNYFIMEFVDGLNLRQVERSGKLTPAEALQIIPQICAALQFAHDEGIVHRDIKPENILLDKKGRVKIADFGIAKIFGRDAQDRTITGEGHVLGTPHYMAPEQVEQPQAVDHRADIFSLGVVFYEMLTGELPLGRFDPPSQKVQIDVRLDGVVLRALEKSPERRYQQASEVRTQVETIAQTPSGGGKGAGPAPARPQDGWKWPAIASAAVAGGAVALLAFILVPNFWRKPQPSLSAQPLLDLTNLPAAAVDNHTNPPASPPQTVVAMRSDLVEATTGNPTNLLVPPPQTAVVTNTVQVSSVMATNPAGGTLTLVNVQPSGVETNSPPSAPRRVLIAAQDVALHFADPTFSGEGFRHRQRAPFPLEFSHTQWPEGRGKQGHLGFAQMLVGRTVFIVMVVHDNGITIGGTRSVPRHRLEVRALSGDTPLATEDWDARSNRFDRVVTLPLDFAGRRYNCPVELELLRGTNGAVSGTYWFCAYLNGRLPVAEGTRYFELVYHDPRIDFPGNGPVQSAKVLGMDIDGVGRIDADPGAGESFALHEPFQIHGKNYRVAEANAFKPEVVFEEVPDTVMAAMKDLARGTNRPAGPDYVRAQALLDSTIGMMAALDETLKRKDDLKLAQSLGAQLAEQARAYNELVRGTTVEFSASDLEKWAAAVEPLKAGDWDKAAALMKALDEEPPATNQDGQSLGNRLDELARQQAGTRMEPTGLAVDGGGNIYAADFGNHAVRKISPDGTVTTLAGNPMIVRADGTPEGDHADGSGTAARFHSPFGVAVDYAHNVYVGDFVNQVIRIVAPDGTVRTMAGQPGIPGGANGVGGAAQFSAPHGVAVDAAGNAYVADADNNAIRKLTPTGTNWTVTTLAGREGSGGKTARLNSPHGVAVDAAGNVYVADTDNDMIREITPGGLVMNLAGTEMKPGARDGLGKYARFNGPYGIAVDDHGNVFVADTSSATIRKLTETEHGWLVSTIAGVAGEPGDSDGIGSAARFLFPSGIAVDNAGNVYVADTQNRTADVNRTIRKLTPSGTNWVVESIVLHSPQ